MSSFSSYGPTPNMTLEPDITAPGGGIYSSVLEGKYSMLSGTSMASPHVAGVAADVKQYLEELGIEENKTLITKNLLMSTANILTDGNGNNYAPKRQGAGLIDLEAALKTKAYLSAGEGELAKLSLGSSGEGVFDMSYYLNRLEKAPSD